MEIDEMIHNKRWHKDYRREQISDYIKKDVAPDMSALYNQYSPVIDGILNDYKLGAGYGLYQEDGHDFMTFRASDCGQACDTYQSKQEGDFIIIQLDAVNKECGSAGYGSSGMSNARYSDKEKKSKVNKGKKPDAKRLLEMLDMINWESPWMSYCEKLSDMTEFVMTELGLDESYYDIINDYIADAPGACTHFDESTLQAYIDSRVQKSKTEKSYQDIANLDYEGLKDLCNSMDSDATEKITREYEAGYIGEADAIGRLTLLAMKLDAEGSSLMNKSKVKKSYRVIGWDARKDFNDVMEQYNRNYQDERNPVIRFATANDTLEGSALSAKEFSTLEDAQKELADWTRGLSASGFTFAIIDEGYNIVKSKTEKSSLDDILNSDDEFKYQMLGRWKSDLDYYFGAGNRNPSNLWAGDFASHINNINMVYNSLDVKPDWLDSDMMKEYIRREGYYE